MCPRGGWHRARSGYAMVGIGAAELRCTCPSISLTRWFSVGRLLALLWVHTLQICVFLSECHPDCGGARSRLPSAGAGRPPHLCRCSQWPAGGSRRCFGQHVQYNLYLFLCWCCLSSDLLNKAIRGVFTGALAASR